MRRYRIAIYILVGLISLYSLNLVVNKDDDVLALEGDISPLFYNSFKSRSSYSISTHSPAATQAAASVLEEGGNAVDAAVAASLMLSLTNPYTSGLGGGGVMLVLDENQEAYYYDFYNQSANQYTRGNIGVPGLLKGLEHVSKKHGKRNFKDLVKPSYQAASKGFFIDEYFRSNFAIEPNRIAQLSYELSHGLTVGRVAKNPQLAKVYQGIMKEGSDYLYQGESSFAKKLMQISKIDKKALQEYQVVEGKPLKIDYLGYEAISAPFPTAGVTLLQMLKMSEKITKTRPVSLVEYNHLADVTYQENRRFNADPNRAMTSELLSEKHLEKLMNKTVLFDDNLVDEGMFTTSISIIDGNGMAVSLTQTISDFWGSGISVQGVLLNNSLSNFTVGKNSYGFNKRPRSFIAPVILYHDENILSLGSAGGQDIPQVLFKIIDERMKTDQDLYHLINKARSVRNRSHFQYEIIDDNIRALNSHLNIPLKKIFPFIGVVSYAEKIEENYESMADYRVCNNYCAVFSNLPQ